jgi:integrase
MKSGLEIRPRIHDLRHTHVSWLIAQGVQLPAISRRLGHESITTTNDRYGHLLPEVDDGLVRVLGAAMG